MDQYDPDTEPIESAVRSAYGNLWRRTLREVWPRLKQLDPSGRLLTNVLTRTIEYARGTKLSVRSEQDGNPG